jgi:hypothetical protein
VAEETDEVSHELLFLDVTDGGAATVVRSDGLRGNTEKGAAQQVTGRECKKGRT